MQAESDTSAILIDLIVPHIPRENLFSFQASSRLCRNRALPAFYSNLSLACHSGDGGSRKLYFLLQSLLHEPGLASLVKSLNVFDVKNERPEDGSVRSTDCAVFLVATEDRELLRRAILSTNLPSMDQWLATLESDNIGPIVLPLILWHCKNLGSLHLDCTFHASTGFLRDIFIHSAKYWSQASPDPDGPYSRLREVEFATTNSEQPRLHAAEGDGHIQGLFFLPAIERISITADQRKGALPFPGLGPLIQTGCRSNTPSLRSLEIKRSEITFAVLHDLLSALPNLTTLRYEWWRNLDGSTKDKHFLTSECMEALSPLKSSLCNLSLAIDFWAETFDIGINPGWYGTRGYVTDLSEWKKLTDLRIPLEIMMSKSGQGYTLPSFPPLLEDLTLTADGFELCASDWEAPDVQTAFRQFLAGWRETCPNLKSVSFVAWDRWGDETVWDDGERESVLADGEAAGVTCRFIGNTF